MRARLGNLHEGVRMILDLFNANLLKNLTGR
jgi:hypothetical protein